MVFRLRYLVQFIRWPIALALAAAGCFGAQETTVAKYRDFALRRDGDVERGRALFHSVEKAACAACHTVDGRGGRAGPDLFAVGDSFPRRELITAILEPSAAIAVGYGATIVETKAGATFYGIVKQANAAATELMGADGKLVRISSADIKAQTGSALSLMPAGLHAAFSLQEFADLIEYLASLRQPENSLTSSRGTPAAIPELATPVGFRALFPEEMRMPATLVRKPGEPRTGLVWFVQLPGEDDAFFAVHQTGRIWRMDRGVDGWTKSLFADFSGEVYYERGPNGLLGLAFHPDFAANRRYFLKHQVFDEGKLATVLVEKQAAADRRADSGRPSRRLLHIPSVTENHSGGTIEFGPDGCLYLAMGDTGPQNDPNGHGQDMQLLLGKMLRIDVDRRDAGLPYAIPADNPFRGRPGARPEIWALGFREPWRFTFDSATGDLWVGDVGQNRVEEVAIVRRGENHGWNVYEGFEPFANERRREGEAYVPPIAAYRRKHGNSVTGGYVYRGDPRSSFHGVYVFGDYTSRKVFGLTHDHRVLKTFRQIGVAPESIASFATDRRGRIFVVGYEGMVYEIDFGPGDFGREREPAAGPEKPLINADSR